jgi:hypothetical protein
MKQSTANHDYDYVRKATGHHGASSQACSFVPELY